MFFRGRQPETSIWQRFRTAADGFTFAREESYYAAHVVANAERVVDLFVSLLDLMPPAVDVAIDDKRSGRSWKGEALPLPDVRDGLARLKGAIAAAGGVEIAVYTSEDQLTLNALLELFIYSRTDHWLYVLQGRGLEERRLVRSKSWKHKRQNLPDAPELVDAVAQLAAGLGLTPA